MDNDKKRTPQKGVWSRRDGDEVIVGITVEQANWLGEMTHIALPEVGDELAAGDEACVVESSKAAMDIYAPVAGRVTAVNEALADAPTLVNTDSDGEGWLYRVQPEAADVEGQELDPLEDIEVGDKYDTLGVGWI